MHCKQLSRASGLPVASVSDLEAYGSGCAWLPVPTEIQGSAASASDASRCTLRSEDLVIRMECRSPRRRFASAWWRIPRADLKPPAWERRVGEGYERRQEPGRRVGSAARVGEQRGEMRSLLRLSLLRPASSSFTSRTLSDVGEGRAATAGTEPPALDLPAGEEPGRSLAPRRGAPGSGRGRAADQLPYSLPARRCALRNTVLLSTKTYFCLSSEPRRGYLHLLGD